MIATVRIGYFDMLDHWSWEVMVNGNSTYGVESDHDNAFDLAKLELEEMLEQVKHEHDRREVRA